MNCENWYFTKEQLFCPDCGVEVALHNVKSEKKIIENNENETITFEQANRIKKKIRHELMVKDMLSVNLHKIIAKELNGGRDYSILIEFLVFFVILFLSCMIILVLL